MRAGVAAAVCTLGDRRGASAKHPHPRDAPPLTPIAARPRERALTFEPAASFYRRHQHLRTSAARRRNTHQACVEREAIDQLLQLRLEPHRHPRARGRVDVERRRAGCVDELVVTECALLLGAHHTASTASTRTSDAAPHIMSALWHLVGWCGIDHPAGSCSSTPKGSRHFSGANVGMADTVVAHPQRCCAGRTSCCCHAANALGVGRL